MYNNELSASVSYENINVGGVCLRNMRSMSKEEESLYIGEISKLTCVPASTIRFYEKCGFLEPTERLHNRYRVFHKHHIYQIQICRLVFGEFVNKPLRKKSLCVIDAAKAWDMEAYERATKAYKEAICRDIVRTQEVIQIVMNYAEAHNTSEESFTKKQAAKMVGTTEESIRNWERNDLLSPFAPYQKRLYTKRDMNRMYIIRLLLDTGYSIMAVKQFFFCLDNRGEDARQVLINPVGSEDLLYKADKYLQALQEALVKAQLLCDLSKEMKK